MSTAIQRVINTGHSWLLRKLRDVQDELADGSINYYFFASFTVIVIGVLIKLPALVTSAQIYAETATIFFKQAREGVSWSSTTHTTILWKI